MSEADLSKLLDMCDVDKTNNTTEIDIYSDDYINSFRCILFTDGSCIGKRAGTKFGGSGVYLHSTNTSEDYSKWNCYKVFEKPPQEEIIIKSLKTNKVLFLGDKQSTEIIEKYTCEEDNCTSIGYSISSGSLFCSRHKREDGEAQHTYEQFQPTNIRAEGNAILIALKTVLYVNDKRAYSTKGIKKWLTEDIYDKLKVIKLMDMDSMNVVVEKESDNKYLIVSDSKFWIELITKWLPGWLSKRTFTEKKNSDIIVKLIVVLDMLARADCSVTFLHVNGHQDKKDKEEVTFYHKGNILADKLATHASKSKDNLMTVLA